MQISYNYVYMYAAMCTLNGNRFAVETENNAA